MMTPLPFSSPPRWLPLRLVLGGIAAAGLLWLTGDGNWQVLKAARFDGLAMRCVRSLVVLVIALMTAMCVGLAAGMLARRLGRHMEVLAAFGGRVLACVPVAALAWGFIGGWVGRLGWPVETLLPAQLPESVTWQITMARLLWEYLAPALLLAIPLAGEVTCAVVDDAAATTHLDFALRARGVPTGWRLWRHHLRQLLPRLRARMQWLCLIACCYLIVVEDVLRFLGWGGWMAQAIGSGGVIGVAAGFVTGGGLMALLVLMMNVLPGRLPPSRGVRVPSLSWYPWLVWAPGFTVLPFAPWKCWLALGLAVLYSSADFWWRAWREVQMSLPLDASRVLGATERELRRRHASPLLWRHVAAWAAAWSAQMLLIVAVIHALHPPWLAGHAMGLFAPLSVATMQDAARTLADPSAALQCGATIALAALCLIQVSRIVRPRTS